MSTCVGSDGAALGETEPDEADALVDGAVAAGAGAAAAELDLVDDGDADGVDAGGACICAGSDCAAGALVPHAESATAAISGNGSSKGNKRRTRPSSLPARARNHGTPFFLGCVNRPRNDRG